MSLHRTQSWCAQQIVKDKVLEVDVKRGRIALTMRMSDAPAQRSGTGAGGAGGNDRTGWRDAPRGAPGAGSGGMRPGNRMDRASHGRSQMNSAPPVNNAMAAALAKLKDG